MVKYMDEFLNLDDIKLNPKSGKFYNHLPRNKCKLYEIDEDTFKMLLIRCVNEIVRLPESLHKPWIKKYEFLINQIQNDGSEFQMMLFDRTKWTFNKGE